MKAEATDHIRDARFYVKQAEDAIKRAERTTPHGSVSAYLSKLANGQRSVRQVLDRLREHA